MSTKYAKAIPARLPAMPGPEAFPTPMKAFAGGWDAHKNRHCIWIVRPPGYTHSHAFDEVALGLSAAFDELGGSAPVVTDIKDCKGRSPIIYGGNLLPAEVAARLPKDSIVINLEQVSDTSGWMTPRYEAVLKLLPVLDYSHRNRRNLLPRGISHAGVLEIGYSKRLTRIAKVAEQDIDVLFYGHLSDRRKAVLIALSAMGYRVGHLSDVYGDQRDALIARAKVLINMHFQPTNVFEIVRVSYLMANACCVLTEGDLADPDIEPYIGSIAIEPYERLVERCVALLADKDERAQLSRDGFAAFSSRSQASILKALVAENSSF